MTLCPACFARRDQMVTGWHQIAIFAGGIIGYVLLWLNIWPGFGELLIAIFLIHLFFILSIIPHELGHALVAYLVGWRVFAIVVGLGKRVFKFKLFGIIFSFHRLPVCGFIQNTPIDARWFRTKQFLIVAAGPAVNATMVVIVVLISRAVGSISYPAILFLITNFLVLVGNLYPSHFKPLNADTDGKKLLDIVFRRKKSSEELRALRFALEAAMRRDEYKDTQGALDWCNKGLALFPKDFNLLTVNASLCLDTGDYRQARETFLQLLPNETKLNRKRISMLNNIAYADALTDDPELLPEADAYSKEAYDSVPWSPPIIGTRGTVLVAMGRFQEGIELLKESFVKHNAPRGKALNACHLAIAYAQMGNRGEGENYLKLARQVDPQCQLIERAEAELGRVV